MKFFKFLAVAMFGFFLVACGGGGSGSSNTGNTPNARDKP